MTVDFRSDTITQPTAAMREAMMRAPLGDDVFGDDPTVKALEKAVAQMFGHEAGLFCPSGTMCNQVAIAVHTRPGDEVICDRLSHIYNYEGGGIARNSGCSVRLLDGDRGRFTAAMVAENINADDQHFARTRLVAAENTCNKGGGAIWDSRELRMISDVCERNGLLFHLDGARLFNALVETGEGTLSVGKLFHTISICLSKGLGCPVGSVLTGSDAFIHEARRVRKVFGGGMRQSGLLAAAGLYALEHHVERLKDDHARARQLAGVLESCGWVEAVVPVETNIVVAKVIAGVSLADILNLLDQSGVRAVGFGPGRIRFVTHLNIGEAEMAHAEQVVRAIA